MIRNQNTTTRYDKQKTELTSTNHRGGLVTPTDLREGILGYKDATKTYVEILGLFDESAQQMQNEIGF
jgi:hypothetical protein